MIRAAAVLLALVAATPASANVLCVQQELAALGYDPGPPDGQLGRRTRTAAGYAADDQGLSLPRLTGATANRWCDAMRALTRGAGMHMGRVEPVTGEGCDTDPPDGYAREIVGTVDGDEVRLRVSAQFGGAVESLTWRGKEFLNTYDHGRQISYAWQMDGHGECLNPTEPGSASDLFKPTSTSRLVSACSSAPNRLTTVAEPAYWLAPGEGGFCDGGAKTAVNETLLSDNLLTKTIEIGYRGIDNVIAFDATIHLPRDHTSLQAEIPTAYLTHEFTAYWRFNPLTGDLVKPESQPLQKPWSFLHSGQLPPIIATPDGAYALGAYTAEPIAAYEILFYDVPNPYDRTSKWNIVLQEQPAPAGDRQYLTFAVIGTLDEVQSAMSELYRLHPTDFDPPAGYVDRADCSVIEGWAWDPKAPGEPIEVAFHEIGPDGEKTFIRNRKAGRPRYDLKAALGDDGLHGFTISTRRVVTDGERHVIAVEAVNSVEGLPNRALIPARIVLECPDIGR